MSDINLDNITSVVAAAQADLKTQDDYVLSLGARMQAGEKIIKVFDQVGQQWTEVKLLDFWQVQYDKYMAMAGYTGDMNGLLTTLNKLLTDTLPTILLPEDRVKAAATKADSGAK